LVNGVGGGDKREYWGRRAV